MEVNMGTSISIQRQISSAVQSAQPETKPNETVQQNPATESQPDTAIQTRGSKEHATEKKSDVAQQLRKSELQKITGQPTPEHMLTTKLYKSSDLAKKFTPMMQNLPAGSSLNYSGMTNATFSKDGTAKGGFEFKVQASEGSDKKKVYDVQFTTRAGVEYSGSDASGQVEGKAGLEGSFTRIMNFKTPQEAALAAKFAAHDAAAITVTPSTFLGPVGYAIIGPSLDEHKWAMQNTKAIEISGGPAAQLAVDAGFKGEKFDVAGLRGETGTDLQTGARYDFAKAGDPGKLTVFATQDLSANLSVSTGFKSKDELNGASFGLGAGVSGKLEMRFEKIYTMEKDEKDSNTGEFPKGKLNQAVKERKEDQVNMILTGSLEGQIDGAEGVKKGKSFELTISGRSADEVMKAGKQILSGNPPSAGDVQWSVKTESTRTHGTNTKPELKIGGRGFGAEIVAQQTDVTESKEYQGDQAKQWVIGNLPAWIK
jgi:hypothetical protein